MSLCPNDNDEWKALVQAVGTFEAYRDWAENDFTTRDPSLVQDKLMQLQAVKPIVAYSRDRTGMNIWNQTPGLNETGTKEQYTQYIDTIFPDSKIKNIVFSSGKQEGGRPTFFTDDFQYSKKYGDFTTYAVINLVNPHYLKELGIHRASSSIIKKEHPEADGIIGKELQGNISMGAIAQEMQDAEEQGESITQDQAIRRLSRFSSESVNAYVVFDSKQVYRLGSNHDVESFKKFVKDNKVISPLTHFKNYIKLNKKEVSGLNKSLIAGRIDEYNQKYGTRHYVPFKQVGQADLYRWDTIDERWNGFNPNQGDIFSAFRDLPDAQAQKNVISEQEAQELITASRRQFPNLPAYLITPEEAELKTKGGWKGAAGFFGTDGNVYFVKGFMTDTTELHEFAHPILRSMWNSKDQGVVDLFHKMYNDVAVTLEGQEIITDMQNAGYTLPPESEFFKEEVLARSLSRRAYDKRNGIKNSPGFLGAIKKILYAIKQFLRKLFTKPISPENLDVNTTLDELADMLANDEFKIDRSLVSQEGIASYLRENTKMLDELTGAKLQEKIQPLLKQLFNITHRNAITSIENLPAMLHLVQDEFGGNLLDDIRKDIWKYKDLITDKVDEMNNQAKSFFSSLYQIDTITQNMSKEVAEIRKAPRTKEDVLRVQTITEFINYFDNFLNEAHSGAYTVLSHELPKESVLISLMDKTNRQIKDIRHDADPIIKEGTALLLGDVMSDMDQKIKDRFEAHIAQLKAAGVKPSVIKSVEDRYNQLKSSPGKIKAMMSGLKGDANALNNMLEGWLYSSDDVVGGMGVFFKNTYNSINNALQSRFTDFVNQVVPLAKAAGINIGISVAAFSKNFLTTRNKPVWVNGELTEHKVLTFINRHTGQQDYDKKNLENKISKAREAFTLSGDPKDELILNSLLNEEKELNKYFYRQYTDEYYDKNTMFSDPIGQRAEELRDDLYRQINELQKSAQTEGDLLDIRPGELTSPAQQIDELHKQLRQLYSLKDLNDEYKTGDDKIISEKLQESRAVNSHFYIYKEYPGKFQKLLSRYEQELVDSGLAPDSKEFIDKRQQWLDNNTIQAVLPEFYELTRPKFDEMKLIYQNAPNISEVTLEYLDTYKELRDTLSGYKDSDGQPVGSDMSEKTITKIKDLQIKAARLKKEMNRGLTEDEQAELESIYSNTKKRGGTGLDQDEVSRMLELRAKANSSGLDQYDLATITRLWKEIGDLQESEPTEYYLDVFNNYMEKLPEELKEQIIDLNKTADIDKNSADYLINLPHALLKDMLESVEGFKEWFKTNHIQKTIYDRTTKQNRKEWSRVASWSITRPLDDSYMERTSIFDLDGNVTSILGKPSQRFYERIVKPEYETPRIAGVTVAPQDMDAKYFKGLPRSKAEGAPDDKYMNSEYPRIQREEPARFTALEKIKELYIDFQKDADPYARLGYDFAMIRRRTSETISSGQNPMRTYWDNLKALFLKRPDDYDSGYNFQDEVPLTSEAYFNNDRNMPVTGTFNLPIEDVSMDLFHGVAQYMGGVERQKQLKQILPFFKATHDVLTDPANSIRVVDGVNKKNLFARLGGKNNRADALFNKMEREFYGQTNTGIFANNKAVNGIVNAAFRGASLSYLAVQIPSAIANMTVQMIQNVIRSVSGEHFTFTELLRGSVMANTASIKIASEIHRNTAHSLTVQLCELFDPIPGQSIQKIGTSQGRSWVRDFASFSWLYSPRKYMENFATLQAFFAMMDHVRIKQTTPEGIKEIKYQDAWELKDSKITLKQGIDPTYDKEGKEFNRIINYMQHVQHDMNGAYDNFSQPEAYRYILYRMYSFLRRYVTTMLTNRFATTRRSPGMMDVRTGFYTETARALWRTIQDPKYIRNLSDSEKGAAKQFLAETGLVMLMWFMYGLFDWDPDDPDKYEKLRAKSGPLPLPFVPETENPFKADGWLSNHMLLQLLKTKSQTEMWIPLPNMGLKDYTSLPSMTPVAVGPTIDLYAKVVDNILKISAGDTRAYYQRTIGPYSWQQEGDPKLFNYLGQTMGFRGATVTPELAIQKQEQAKVLK